MVDIRLFSHDKPSTPLRLVIAKKLVVVLMMSMMILSFLPSDVIYAVDVGNDKVSMDGSGTEGDPYIITNVTELQSMNDDKTAYYKLGNDIDASDTSTWNGGAGFDPIGDGTTQFTGGFDGDDYNITDLYIDRETEDYIGLFGYATGYDIHSVRFIDVDITGQHYVGSLGGWFYGVSKIYNCSAVGGTVSGVNIAGGLIGNIRQGRLDYSFADVDVTSTGTALRTGGLVGYTSWENGNVYDCYAMGNVSGDDKVGGLTGHVGGNARVYRSYSTGYVSGNTDVGGLVGYNANLVSSSYWNTDTSNQSTSDGGVGKNTSEMTDWENDYPDCYSGFSFVSDWQVTDWNTDREHNSGYAALGWEIEYIPPSINITLYTPSDSSLVNDTFVVVSANATQDNGDDMNITFYDGSDNVLGVNNTVTNGTYSNDWTGLDWNTTYTWYVTGYDGTDNVSSDTWSFTTRGLPDISLVEPTNNSDIYTLDVTLGVDVSQYNGDSMDVSFYSSIDGYLGGNVSVSNGTYEFIWSGLDYNTTYDWYVTVYDGYNNVTSDTWTFVVYNGYVPTITMSSPADGSTQNALTVALEVSVSDDDGDLMNITFYDNSTGNVIDTVSGVANGTHSVTWSGLIYDTTYYWYAIVTDGTNTNTSDVWSFTTWNELYIYDWDDLGLLRTYPNINATLMNDLDDTVADWSSPFFPIDDFTGIFDGQNYTISDLEIGDGSSGWFIEDMRGDIYDLNVNYEVVWDYSNVALFRYLYGSVDDMVVVHGGLARHGGLAYLISGGTVNNTHVSGGNVLGGMAVGMSGDGAMITNSSVSGNVSAGGFVCDMYSPNDMFGGGLIEIRRSSFRGNIVPDEFDGDTDLLRGGHDVRHSVGGLVGYIHDADGNGVIYIKNSLVHADMYGYGESATDEYIGGLVGYIDGNITIVNSYHTGRWYDLDNTDYLGGLVAYSSLDTDVYNTYWDTEMTNITDDDTVGGVGLSRVDMVDYDTYSSWDITELGDIDDRDTGYIWNMYDGWYPILSWEDDVDYWYIILNATDDITNNTVIIYVEDYGARGYNVSADEYNLHAYDVDYNITEYVLNTSLDLVINASDYYFVYAETRYSFEMYWTSDGVNYTTNMVNITTGNVSEPYFNLIDDISLIRQGGWSLEVGVFFNNTHYRYAELRFNYSWYSNITDTMYYRNTTWDNYSLESYRGYRISHVDILYDLTPTVSVNVTAWMRYGATVYNTSYYIFNTSSDDRLKPKITGYDTWFTWRERTYEGDVYSVSRIYLQVDYDTREYDYGYLRVHAREHGSGDSFTSIYSDIVYDSGNRTTSQVSYNELRPHYVTYPDMFGLGNTVDIRMRIYAYVDDDFKYTDSRLITVDMLNLPALENPTTVSKSSVTAKVSVDAYLGIDRGSANTLYVDVREGTTGDIITSSRVITTEGTHTFDIDDLTEDTTYSYRFRIVYDDGESDSTGWTTFTTEISIAAKLINSISTIAMGSFLLILLISIAILIVTRNAVIGMMSLTAGLLFIGMFGFISIIYGMLSLMILVIIIIVRR